VTTLGESLTRGGCSAEAEGIFETRQLGPFPRRRLRSRTERELRAAITINLFKAGVRSETLAV
jgi:hypothetical protein